MTAIDEAPAVVLPAGGVVERPTLAWRREFKFPVPRTVLSRLVADLRGLLQPDPYAAPSGRYVVRSLYLDSPDFYAYFERQLGVSNRAKLRVRTYGPHRDGGVKFEIKHRRGEWVSKDVGLVDRATYAALLPTVTRFAPLAPTALTPPVARFLAMQRRFAMRPVLNIEFVRHAYVSAVHRQLRATVDERIVAWRASDIDEERGARRQVFDGQSGILEVKVLDALPANVETLLRKYRLPLRSVSKYAAAAPISGIGLSP